jgi:hypothetical protein
MKESVLILPDSIQAIQKLFSLIPFRMLLTGARIQELPGKELRVTGSSGDNVPYLISIIQVCFFSQLTEGVYFMDLLKGFRAPPMIS